MDESQLKAELNAALSEPARKAIINALDQAYVVRKAMHDRSIGDDNQSFGMLVYKSGCHFLANFVDEDGEEEGVSLFQPGQMFALKAGRFILAPYRLPDQPDAKSEEAFPYNQNGAGELAKMNYERRRQIYLFPDEQPPRIGIVIAHTGDPDVGLTSVSLREPIDEKNGRISEWGLVVHLWPEQEEGSTEAGVPVFPPEEPISEPEVGLRTHPDISTDESDEDEERPAASSDDS